MGGEEGWSAGACKSHSQEVRIRWLRRRLETRDVQLDYVAKRHPAAAARLGEAIRGAVAILADHPGLGHVGRVDGTRELVVARTPYVIVYRVVSTEVRIIRVLHSARPWLPES